MNVGIIGGTGFVGSYIVDELVAQGEHPLLLVRAGSESKVRQPEKCTLITGDINQPESIEDLISRCAAVIYNIGILREFPARGITFRNLQFEAVKKSVDLAKKHSIKRFVLMSANGVHADGTEYQRTKFEAEEYLKSSGLDWTIFRPSVIFGDPRGRMEFATQLKNEIVSPPLPAPLFFTGINPGNAGKFELSPVHVLDVAQAFVAALDSVDCAGQIYQLCGPEDLSWKDILMRIAQASGKKRKLTVPAPVFGVKAAATVFDRFAFFPVTRGQITMLLEGNTCPGKGKGPKGEPQIDFNRENLSYLQS